MTTYNQLTFIGCRLAAIVLTYFLCLQVPILVSAMWAGFFQLQLLFMAGLQLAWILTMWFGARPIARGILGRHRQSADAAPVTPRGFLAAGLALIGVFLLVTSVPALISGIATLGLSREMSFTSGVNPITVFLSSALLSEVIGFLLGLWLLAGANWIARVVIGEPKRRKRRAEPPIETSIPPEPSTGEKPAPKRREHSFLEPHLTRSRPDDPPAFPDMVIRARP